ncbi:hypothetical protein CL689_00410 [Candidatus Saccharibacteria bacterium]|nr:hypothetical protein [Candidatus Saccharibacteria bacterium]|tara:strand:- start:1582 stop:2757 length:1176 start_codon:yes stop_codon:yes gene_type:complete
MHIALLGRQPELSIAELERLFGDVSWCSPQTALIDTSRPLDIQQLGGVQKLGRVILRLPKKDWRTTSMKLVQHYQKQLAGADQKVTLGLSAYGFPVSARDVQKTGLILKAKLKQTGVSLRLVPNQEAALSTATSHHNKLGLVPHKIELLVIFGTKEVIVAESTGAQNITALAQRDQGRPKRDAFVGMLPPKLALLMINLAGALPENTVVLDPFCGTGVVLQEALLRGYSAYGTDLSEKMVAYSNDNLAWLDSKHAKLPTWRVHAGDATDTTWQPGIGAVVAETYLGQPFSAPPSPAKLKEVRGNCNHIISQFLRNLRPQISDTTPVVIAVPAWRDKSGNFTHLPLVTSLAKLGYRRLPLKTVASDPLLYFRPDQVVAREILILEPIASAAN